MIFLQFLTAFIIAISSFTSVADPCDKDEILRLMALNGHIDLKDDSFCLDLDEFPNIRIKLNEGNYELGQPRQLSEKIQSQDNKVINLINLLNKSVSEDKKKFTVKARGYADGTFNTSSDNDSEIINTFGDGKSSIDLKIIKNSLSSQDSQGFNAIEKEFIELNNKRKVSDDAPIKWNEINENSRLKSLIRNSYLAKKRGDKLCSDLFQNSSECESSGEISPTLDNGKRCFAGCCDGRRGSIIEILAPQNRSVFLGGKGEYKPHFKLPSRSLQGKLQLAASLSVFDFQLDDDDLFEKAILDEGKFEEFIDKDRDRFRKAMATTGCAGNNFSIDSARRIYWAVKSLKNNVSKELYEAVLKNDFNTVYSFYEKKDTSPQAKYNRNLLSILFSGGNDKTASLVTKSNCPPLKLQPLQWGDSKSYKGCAISADSDNFLKGKTIYDLAQMTKPSKKQEQNIFIIQDFKNYNNFYLFDRNTNSKYYFSFDKDNTNCRNLGVPSNYKTKNRVRIDDDPLIINCFQEITKTKVTLPPEFTQYSNTSNGHTPTDSMNCLNIAKALDHELRNRNLKGDPIIGQEASLYQKPLCQLQKNGSLSISLNTEVLKNNHSKNNHSKDDLGFFCTACNSGVKFKPETNSRKGSFFYKPRQTSTIKGNQTELAEKTWSDVTKSSEHPLTMGSAKHLRSYIIPNCGPSCNDACACLRDGNIENIIKNPDVTTHDFTTILPDNKMTIISTDPKTINDIEAGKRQFSCIFTPPVPYTCSFNPVGEISGEEEGSVLVQETCPIIEELKKTGIPHNIIVKDEDIIKYKNDCTNKTFPSTQEQCLQDQGTMCRKKIKTNNCQEQSNRNSSNSTHQ